MPEPYYPKAKSFPLSRLNEGGPQYLRVRCTSCKRQHNYLPDDLVQLFGDVDVDSLRRRMRCEGCGLQMIEVKPFSPTGREAVGLKLRRLVAIRIRHEPVWWED